MPSFVGSEAALRVATTAARSGMRPSDLLRIQDEVRAFLLDEALTARLMVERLRAMSKSKSLPDGFRFETEADFAPPESGPVATPHPELLE